MAGFQRMRPTLIPASERRPYTCTTRACPDEAIMRVPLNVHIAHDWDLHTLLPMLDSMTPASLPGKDRAILIEMRLCRKCIRGMASALPAGMRLEGAVLRYSECDPDELAPEDIPGTPEADPVHRAHVLQDRGLRRRRRAAEQLRIAREIW